MRVSVDNAVKEALSGVMLGQKLRVSTEGGNTISGFIDKMDGVSKATGVARGIYIDGGRVPTHAIKSIRVLKGSKKIEPAKRGRKPKEKTNGAADPAEQKAADTAPKRRGRPRKETKEDAPVASKGRGGRSTTQSNKAVGKLSTKQTEKANMIATDLKNRIQFAKASIEDVVEIAAQYAGSVSEDAKTVRSAVASMKQIAKAANGELKNFTPSNIKKELV